MNDNCVILGNVNVNSPLVWDGTMTNALRAYARANQAAVIVPFILGGAMGPVTSAGGIAQSLGRDDGGLCLDAVGTQGRAGDFRQLPVVDEFAVGLARRSARRSLRLARW